MPMLSSTIVQTLTGTSDPGVVLALVVCFVSLFALVGKGAGWLLTARIGVGEFVNDYRAVDAGEADAVRGLVSVITPTGTMLSTYKPPNMNMNMI